MALGSLIALATTLSSTQFQGSYGSRQGALLPRSKCTYGRHSCWLSLQSSAPPLIVLITPVLPFATLLFFSTSSVPVSPPVQVSLFGDELLETGDLQSFNITSQRRRVVCTQLPSSTATPLWELVKVLHRNKSRVAFNIRGPGIVQKPNPATDHVGTGAATTKPPQATGHIMLDSIPIWTRLIPRIGTYNTQDSLVVTGPTTSLALTDNACWCRPQEGYQADCRSSTVSFITTPRAMTDSLVFRCLSSRPPRPSLTAPLTMASRIPIVIGSKPFFRKPAVEKAACVDAQSYAGYIAFGKETNSPQRHLQQCLPSGSAASARSAAETATTATGCFIENLIRVRPRKQPIHEPKLIEFNNEPSPWTT
ncbi:hypothetical protein B0T09DRAFT_363288 [Sordaria sp. MPI-SDFR-AT-0083]|nr:hypothetical protein B0T09DRAFT_363288 [Sordaria sp. MPI-SDFR-AT-0083]